MKREGRALLLPFTLVLTAAVLVAEVLAQAGSTAPQAPPSDAAVPLLDIRGGIGPATRDYVVRGLDKAASANAPAVVLRIDTPGGLDAATRDINQAILASHVPVIAWVAPQGARAASAGTYIVYACHLAAMAPATSIGAATPVSLGGPGASPPAKDERPPTKQGDKQEQTRNDETDPPAAGRPTPAPRGSDNASERKAVNDAAAYLRSLAELRGRNADFAERAVRDAATLTASQARAQGVVELLANDLDALLRQADGRTLELQGRSVTLATAGRTVAPMIPDWRVRLLAVITEPTVAYLLLLIGLYGLVFEGYSPGAILPGVVGAICLLLALYALQVLPVNYAGVALIVLGVALMTAEIAMPSVGALGIGGVVALVAGSLILFDPELPGFGVSGHLIAGIGLVSALAFTGVLWMAARARRQPVTTGTEELVGHLAVAVDDFDGRGQVRIRGEIWQAISTAPASRGEPLRVLAMDGLTLRVAPVPASSTPRPPIDGGPR
jgi:membrane-bound serine protease (ClpP class)